MIKIDMPSGAKRIISVLADNGYEAYIVGGCVRDALLGRVANDFDITTSALPSEVKELFSKTVDTGIKHGTVTVICEDGPYEVTTYRIDGEYRDMRHPVSVSYTDKLADDLLRRDFTVNAMAYNDSFGIADVSGGMADLAAGVIRAVGDASVRFTEDALRVLRGIRFASVLGFSIEESTALAIREKAPNLCGVSAERIYTEWYKLVGGAGAYDIISEYADVIGVFLPEITPECLPARESFLALDARSRQIALFASYPSSTFTAAMRRMKTDSVTATFGAAVIDAMASLTDTSDTSLKLLLIKYGDEVALCAANILECLGKIGTGTVASLNDIIMQNFPRRADMLAVRGNDIKALGILGKRIGEAISEMLTALAEGRAENTRESLLALIADMKNG